MADIWGRLLASKARRTDAFEAFSAVLAGIWGTVLIVPADTFATAVSYRVMARLGTEDTWMVFGWSAGIMQAAGLSASWLLGGRELRILGACFCAAFWAAVGSCILAANPVGHGGYTYLSLSFVLLLTAVSLHADKPERTL